MLIGEAFNIGKVKIENRLLLAPLASVADRAFREICREKGAALSCSEMISAKGVHYDSEKSLELDSHGEIESPYAVQIFGREPDLMAEAAKIFEERGADIIDINMGCPVRKVTSNGEGSALMKEPDLAAKIVESIVKNVNIPVTVKMRRGYETGSELAVTLAKKVEEAGASAVAVHGRYRDQLYSGKSDLATIKAVKEAVTIPVIGNGDVVTREDAEKMMKETGCDAVMIGRGALGNPWVFENILTGNTFEKMEKPEKVVEMIQKHYELSIKYKGEHTAVREMRTHLGWYLKGFRGSASIRDAVCKEQDPRRVMEIIKGIC